MAIAAATASRPVFWHMPVALKVLWYVLAVVSVIVFLYGWARPITRWRRGRGGPWPPVPWRDLPNRLWTGARALAAHSTITRGDRLAGWGHRAIFYGFIVLFIGTVVLGFDTDFTRPVFGWDYFHGTFYLFYKEVLNLLGTVLIAGVLVMMMRRAILRPVKLTYRPGDWVFLGTLLTIALTGFVLEGVRIAMDDPGHGGAQFGGWVVAQALTGVGRGTPPDCATAYGGSTACSRLRSSPPSRTRRLRTCSRAI